MRQILYLVIVFLICFYVYDYYRIPADLTVLQSTLNNFQFELLREKQPIVIQDRVPTLDMIHNLWFRHNKTTHLSLSSSPIWSRNRYKYMVMQAQQPCDIMITLGNVTLTEDGSPDPELVTPVAIRLQSNQFVVLPYRSYWIASPTEGSQICHFDTLGVHDYISFLLP